MIAIFKYPISLAGQQVVYLPRGAEVLSVQVQKDVICLWAKVNTNSPLIGREVAILGTGQEYWITSEYKYLGTVQEGVFVWHVFIKYED